ncbi:MAG TPA: GNAT family N-acetyltransferase [Ardenticatenaceae bacterium]
MSSAKIRLFQPEDQEVARDLILSGLGEHFGYIDPSYNPDVDDIGANYVTAGQTFVVVERDGVLVGTGALLVHNEEVGQLVRMSVHQGQRRQGLGRALVSHLLQIARGRGLRKVIVETNNDWYDAIGLYERCGFVEYGRDEISVYMELEL